MSTYIFYKSSEWYTAIPPILSLTWNFLSFLSLSRNECTLESIFWEAVASTRWAWNMWKLTILKEVKIEFQTLRGKDAWMNNRARGQSRNDLNPTILGKFSGAQCQNILLFDMKQAICQ